MVCETYVDDIARDEMRSGFLVTTDRKKLWNVQLNMIVEFARLCRKYELKWYAYGGTALGAARHGGFIPWDDDIDLAMLRPDFEKFKRVAASELSPKYFLDLWYNYAWEGEPNPEGFSTITRAQLDQMPWLPFSSLLRIRDKRTTFLRYPEYDNFDQSIWIDVIPLDPVPPFDEPEHEKVFERGYELLLATTYPAQLARALNDGEPLLTSRERLDELLSLPYKQRALAYEQFVAENYFASKYVSFRTFRTRPEGAVKRYFQLTRSNFDGEAQYAPFERLTLPMPIDCDQYLRERYGDWRKLIFTHAHATIFSADVPCQEYYASRAQNPYAK